MTMLRTLSNRLAELRKELDKELENRFSVSLELVVTNGITNNETTVNGSVKITIFEGVWSVNQHTVKIDFDAPLHETILFVKNKFNMCKKFDEYRRKEYSLNSIINKLNMDADFLGNRVWWCADTDMLCMRSIFSTDGISCYYLGGKITFDDKDYKDIRNHFNSPTFSAFEISKFYPEFKSYLRKFMDKDVNISENGLDPDFEDLYEGDDFNFIVCRGLLVLSELDIKAFITLGAFEEWFKQRKEAKISITL